MLAELAERELVPEAWGGDTIVIEISALENIGIDDLLENILLVAEVEDLRVLRSALLRAMSGRPPLAATPSLRRSRLRALRHGRQQLETVPN